jgi:hypothetical protein
MSDTFGGFSDMACPRCLKYLEECKCNEVHDRCPSCEVLMINGIRCHEQGCPDAWRSTRRTCRNCETEFIPQEKGQRFCTEFCSEDYSTPF